MIQRTYLILLLSLFASCSVSYSQIIASDTTGCSPMVDVQLQFNDSSVSNILWDFGDGTSAVIIKPTHTFRNPGSYNVIFTGSLSGSPVKDTLTIIVYGKPVPNFTAAPPTTGCVPITVSFNDQSTGGGGTSITIWEWAFGDGGVNITNTPTPSYTYTLPGSFNVALKVTDANGCDSTITKKNVAATSFPPLAQYTTSPVPPIGCNPPFLVDFINQSISNSTTGINLTYEWDFGNGQTSTLKDPADILYNNYGTDTVTLKVTDNNNCSTKVTGLVIVQTPAASFTVNSTFNDTVCTPASFTNTSTAGTYTWSFGDSVVVTDTSMNFTHDYLSGGYFNVKLEVAAGTCKDDTTIKIFVEEIIADFTAFPTYTCFDSLVVQYTDLSTNAVKWLWQFNFADTSSQQNPSHTYNAKDISIYGINYERYFTDFLTVKSEHGCMDEISKKDTIYVPNARFMPDVAEGCMPLTVTFHDSSNSKEPITSYLWNFGDGTTAVSTDTFVTHTFTNDSIYNVYLVITNSNGCKDTSYKVMIKVGKTATPNFSVDKTNVCPYDVVQFTDLTPASDSIDTWHYTTDDDLMWACYTEPNPVWSFRSDTGFMDITLKVGYNGCYTDTTIQNMVYVKGPIIKSIKYNFDCGSPFVYTFEGYEAGADTVLWDFGDGLIMKTIPDSNPVHTYSISNDYMVFLTGFNNTSGCIPSVDTMIVPVKNIQAAFSSKLDECASVGVGYDATASLDVNAQCSMGYQWNFGDSARPYWTNNAIYQYAFPNGGSYNVRLIVDDVHGCQDTAYQPVSVYKVNADFSTNTNKGCIPFTVNFTDTSTADTILTQWTWDFGDNSSSNLQNPTHLYSNLGIGVFQVKLIVKDSLGCIGIKSMTIYASIPDTNFIAITTKKLCAGASGGFFANGINELYDWNFGDGDTLSDTLQTVFHVFDTAGIYDITLTVTDSLGCKSSRTRNAYMDVQDYPVVGFLTSADTLESKCYPLLVNFTDTSIVNIFKTRTWNLGTGTAIVPLETVGTLYDQPGTYDVSLIIETTNGCKDTLLRSLKIQGPRADFDLSPQTICKGQSIAVNLKDTFDVFVYSWDFGDGYDTANVSPINHTYNITPIGGQTLVTLIYWSDDSTCPKTVVRDVFIPEVIADFNRNNESTVIDSIHCLGIQDIFTDTSTNADSWEWNFGDAETYVGKNPPVHSYAAAGKYYIELLIKDSTTGCEDKKVKSILINPLPLITAVGGNMCWGESIQISASGAETYVWSPITSLSNANINDPFASPDVSIEYTVSGTDSNGCINTDSAMVIVQQKPPEVIWDTTIVIGEKVFLNAYAGDGFVYKWIPDSAISCSTCFNPVAEPHGDAKYTLVISDTAGCFELPSYYSFTIRPLTAVDVPNAFTPNGDGINDFIFPDGWGIKSMVEFKIFNRWGQLLFKTSNINEGWDGTYKGTPQNADTYTYLITVNTWVDNKQISKKGVFTLVR